MTAPFAVGFDFDHTLGLDHGLEVHAFELLGAERGAPFDEDALKTQLARYRGGEQSLDEMFAAVGGNGLAARWQALCMNLVERVTPLAGAREVLAALASRGIPTAILTNGWSPLQEAKIARAVGFAGPILVSEAIGARKPDAAAFAHLARVLGMAPAQCWYVGDNPDADVLGAQAFGMRGVWFDWEGIRYPAGAPAPAARIGALDELLAVLPGHGAPAQNVAT